jgi:replication-associated recombination protein RarA
MKTKRVVCFWGGPGTGKSTTAAVIFANLKKLQFNCELNREYGKKEKLNPVIKPIYLLSNQEKNDNI